MVKRIIALVPIAVKGKYFLVKRGIEGEGDRNLVIIKITNHLLADITKLIHRRLARLHSVDIQRALVSVIGRAKQRKIVPNLLYDIGTLNKNFPTVSVKNDITDIITERFVKGSCFGIKYADIHF